MVEKNLVGTYSKGKMLKFPLEKPLHFCYDKQGEKHRNEE